MALRACVCSRAVLDAMLCAQVWLSASGLVVRDYFVPPWPMQKLSLPIPKAATASGKLSLSCAEHKGIGGTGRTCNIAERLLWQRHALGAALRAQCGIRE